MSALTELSTNLSSLDLKCESVPGCSRVRPTIIYNKNDISSFFWAGCGAWHCDYCGPVKARRMATTIAWRTQHVERSRFITLTQAPEDWQKRRAKMRKMALWARKQDLDWNVSWTTELGSNTGMIHIHAIQWGSYIKQSDLQDRWGNIVDIRSIKTTDSNVAKYIIKSSSNVGKYIIKSSADDHKSWINLNGGRGIHVSRGYWGDLSLREAMKAASVANGADPSITWLIAEGDVKRTILDTYSSVEALRRL